MTKALSLAGLIWLLGSSIALAGTDDIGPPVIPEDVLLPVTTPRPTTTRPRSVRFSADEAGHFHVAATANGVGITFLVDTGASAIVLGKRDARRAGIDVGHLTFDGRASTANGIVRTAAAHIARLSVGPFTFTDVPVSVNETELDEPLLGMTFLRRLSVSIDKGTLTLTGGS